MMICPRCDGEEFYVDPTAEVEQLFMGRDLKVVTPVTKCVKCSWMTLSGPQFVEIGRRACAAYDKCLEEERKFRVPTMAEA
jgi:hypothetical protein